MCHEVSYSFKSYEILCMPQKEKAALVKTKGKRYTSEVSFGVFGIQDTNFGNKKKTGIKEIWGKRYIMEYVIYGMQSTEIVKFCNRKRYEPNIFATLTNKMWDSQPPSPNKHRHLSLPPALPTPNGALTSHRSVQEWRY